MKKIGNKIVRIFQNICLVDRFLILFMLILFCYMIVHLILGKGDPSDSNTIDIIVRTSAAAIFGYFISSNFIKTVPTQINQTPSIDVPLDTTSASMYAPPQVKSQIGFQQPVSAPAEELERLSIKESEFSSADHCNKIQVVVVAAVGLSSLVILLIARHYQEITPELTAIVSQLRDFVSASIGFLISCGKNKI